MLRRDFLGDLARLAALSAVVPNVWRVTSRPRLADDPFRLGVASGDPLPDRVVLWTRLAPRPLEPEGGMEGLRVAVRWQVAHDEAFASIVREGRATAVPELSYSVHVDVPDLEPDRWYFYRFIAGDATSPVGRARTAPRAGALTPLALGVVSCQHWETGLFTAYDHMAREELDLVAHLGDYIYEYGPTPGRVRTHAGLEIRTVDDYRRRYAQYKSDPDLQRVHAAHPFFVTFDDHEVANNWAGDNDEGGAPPEVFRMRRASAFQAWYEHMPVRRSQLPNGAALQLYRGARYGNLAALDFLDTRQYRTDQPCGDGLKNCDGRFDPGATMTGADQERWLLRGLDRSPARWNVLAQQTIFAEVDFNPAPGSVGPAGLFNVDQWDGYVAQRRRISQFLADRKPSNPVVITGDIHSSWANDVKLDYDNPASPTVASEFVGTSISSDFPAVFIAPVNAALVDNPHIKFFDGEFRGYVLCSVTPERWRTDFRAVASVDAPDAPVSTLRSFVVENGEPGVKPA